MDWNKYFKEKDAFKRYAMLERENRLSYDHVDNWLFSLKYFLSKTQANPKDLSANSSFIQDFKMKMRDILLSNLSAEDKLRELNNLRQS